MVNSPHIEIYFLEISSAEYFLNLELLSTTEKIRYDRYKYENDAHNFLIARAVLKTQLAEKLAIEASSVELSISAEGKPYLADCYKKYLKNTQQLPQFSIAHCEGAVVVAISNEPVGVDVENVRRSREPWRKAGQMINKRVQAVLEGLSEDEAEYEFARQWTCLEAYVKLHGSSIAAERAQFVLNKNTTTDKLTFLQAEFFIREFAGSRLVSVSSRTIEPEIKQYIWSAPAFVVA